VGNRELMQVTGNCKDAEINNERFQVLTEELLKLQVIWHTMPCHLVISYNYYKQLYCIIRVDSSTIVP
jgi:hypothetical protein